MATFSRTLEHTLRRALSLANEHRHEYVTLEHLLLSLIDDDDAAQVMHACKVDLDKLKLNLESYLSTELDSLVVPNREHEEPRPTAGFQRVLQRSMLHVHQNGVGVCGIFTYEVAETKVAQVLDLARRHEHPLQCTMEKE